MINSTRPIPQPEFVRSLFASIAEGYDRANDVMTFGLARLWRKKLVGVSEVPLAGRVLDCATGTGDLAFEFKKKVGSQGQVTACDFCQPMLDLGAVKSQRLNLEVDFKLADVMSLPFKDNSFDATSIAYGIRNVADPQIGISEMARVTKSGGWVLVLETGEFKKGILGFFLEIYFSKIVPMMGGWITGKKDAYQYLSNSTSYFPCRTEFVRLMESTGQFNKVECQPLMGGASFIYRGKKA